MLMISATSQDLLLQARSYIAEHFSEAISMKQLAQVLEISVYRLQNLFLQNEDCSVHAYIKNYRMRQAETLLLDSTMPVSDIAKYVGYDSHSKFSRAFCVTYGVSPLRFRKNGVSGPSYNGS